MPYPNFFEKATNHRPCPWQERLALDPEGQSRFIDIPTGLGKTAGVVLAWLWNRMQSDENSPWPRRLIYCLPMRTLVEQTEGEVRKWIEKLSRVDLIPQDHKGGKPRVVILMGGESPGDKEWDLYPEELAIIIGTQDMLLSRALNRGYGMSRYRWPMHFALLNNDALWVMDEVQLMGPGLAATTQLKGFHNVCTELGALSCHSWWMSATIRPDWLKTVDMPNKLLAADPLQLSSTEKHDGDRVETLRTASKGVNKSTVDSGAKHLKAVAQFIEKNRSADGLNLVVVNTVKRARELFAELKKLLKDDSKVLLLHSQFRPDDRWHVLEEIKHGYAGKVVVSTQVIEAGVDLSARTLFTELAPWSSLVQRFGRCNRWLIDGHHHYTEAQIYWFDLPEDKDHLPYTANALKASRGRLQGLSNAAIQHLEAIASPDEDKPEFRHVIRRKDLVDLFDTTPDLAGADLDIDRFIRDADDSHVQVFWRNWLTRTPNGDADSNEPETAPQRFELCTVSIGDFRDFVKKNGPAYRWNALDHEWQTVAAHDIYPGQTYLLQTSQGGYNDDDDSGTLPTGWTGDPKNKPKVGQAASLSPRKTKAASLSPRKTKAASLSQSNEKDRQAACPTLPEAYDSDAASESDQWQTIAQHTDDVCDALETLIGCCGNTLSAPEANALRNAARWHDWGKAHRAFQAKLNGELLKAVNLHGLAAKAPESAWRKGRISKKPVEGDDRRPHFRHELASALGVLLPDSGFPLNRDDADTLYRDLAAYLIAAHHGRVRLSIRSMPDEWIPPKADPDSDTDGRFARGVWDGDALPGVDLGGSTTSAPVTLSLEPMELGLGEQDPFCGQPSWAERCLTLRDTLGPFKLAYCETLLRAADGRASTNPKKS